MIIIARVGKIALLTSRLILTIVVVIVMSRCICWSDIIAIRRRLVSGRGHDGGGGYSATNLTIVIVVGVLAATCACAGIIR